MRMRSLLACLLATFLTLGLLVTGTSAPASAEEAEDGYTVSAGTVDWGFKESFRTYVPDVGQSAVGGAIMKDDGTFSWPVSQGAYDPETRALNATATGQVVFNFQAHMFEITIADPIVTVQDGSGLLNAEIIVKTLDPDTGEVRSTITKRADLAELDLARGTRVVGDGTIDWTDIPATLTTEGAEAFAADMTGNGTLTYFYTRGTILDPVNLHLTGDWPAQSEEEVWTEPGTAVPIDVERLVQHLGLLDNDRLTQILYDSERGIIYARVAPSGLGTASVWAIDAENGGLLSDEPILTTQYTFGAMVLDSQTGALTVPVRTSAADVGLVPENYFVTVLATIPRVDEGWGPTEYRVLDRELTVLSGIDPATGDVYGINAGAYWDSAGEAVPTTGHGHLVRFPAALATPGVTDVAQLPELTRTAGGVYEIATVTETPTAAILDWDRDQALLLYRGRSGATAHLDVIPLGSLTPEVTSLAFPLAGQISGSLSETGVLFVPLTDGTVRAIDVTDGATEIASLPHPFSTATVAVDDTDGRLWVQGPGTTEGGNPLGAYDISGTDTAQWRLMGTRMIAPGATSNHQMAVGPQGSLFVGIYASSVGDAAEQGVRRIELFSSPSITTQPVDVAVVEGAGDAAEFTVAGTGSPEPAVIWQEKSAFGWSDLADGEGVSGAATGTLRLEGDAVVDGRQVRAVLSNGAEDFRGTTVDVGSLASDIATISVHRAPVIATQPTAQTVTEGADATFTVLADGNPEPAVVWQRNVAGFWTDVATDDNVEVSGSTLTVKATNTGQSGAQFRAKLTNSVSTVFSRTVALTVNPRTEIPEEGLQLEGVTFEWSGSDEMQASPPAGGSNFFTAGVSDGTQGTYSVAEADVSIVHRSADGTETAPTWETRAAQVSGEVTQLVRFAGGEADIQADGSADVQWDGSWSVNFYGGMVPFTLTDLELTVAADGTGTLIADLSGCASTMDNPTVCTALDPVQDATVATFSGVTIDPAGAVTIDPDYEGVEIEVPEEFTPQNRTNSGWGAWPQDMVDFHFATGLSSYWYSSGGAADAKKPPAPFVVDFTDAVPVDEVEPTAPVIVAEPIDVRAFVGDEASLTVTADGDDLSYGWLRQFGSFWLPLVGQESASLDFASITADDAAQYRVVVSNDQGSVTSRIVTVTVMDPFTDVPSDHVFASDIRWLAVSGITTGYDDGTFRPSQPVLREQIAAFFYRLAGSPDFTPEGQSFADVPVTHTFYREIEWFAQQGITTGYDDGTFRPSQPVLREQIAAFLYRYDGADRVDADGARFTDVSESHVFFDQVEWLAQTGITTGYDDGTFRPSQPVLREQIAAFLYRLEHPEG